MTAFKGTYNAILDEFSAFTLVLDREVDGKLTGSLTNFAQGTKNWTCDLEGSFLPWDSHHNRYLFTLSGHYSVTSRDTQPHELWYMISLVGFAEATRASEPLDSLTLIQSWTSDEPTGHGNNATAWPSAIGFTRT